MGVMQGGPDREHRALHAVLRAERAGALTPGRRGDEVDRLERLRHLHRVRDEVGRRRVTLHHDPAGADVGGDVAAAAVSHPAPPVEGSRP